MRGLPRRNWQGSSNAEFYIGRCSRCLTYKEKPTQKQAAAALKKILRKLRSEFKKQGKTLKYIAVTEYIGKRIHHHIVINTQDTTMLVRLWEEGYVNMKALDESGDYTKLAKYFIKESDTLSDTKKVSTKGDTVAVETL